MLLIRQQKGQDMAFRAVVFDMGGVLFTPPEPVLLRPWEERFGLAEGELFERLYGHPVAQQALTGKASTEEMFEESRRLWPSSSEDWEAFWAERREQVSWDTELLAFIARLRPKYKTGLISNASLGGRAYFERHVEGDIFDVILFSGEEGVAKPDPEIYRRALSRLGVRAEEAIFFDDWPPNVEAARSLGMHAVLCDGSFKVMEAVERLLQAD